MKKKNILWITFIISFFLILVFFYFKLNDSNELIEKKRELDLSKKENIEMIEDKIVSSNIIEDVSYAAKDAKGNEYFLKAAEGVIDQNDSNHIFLTSVKAIINIKNYRFIEISSDFGKYNINNYDTIFSKNVIIDYLENKITGEYLDFSLIKNKMIFSKNIVYTNLENILQADVIEIDIDTKDTKIFMYETNKKVNIKNKNF